MNLIELAHIKTYQGRNIESIVFQSLDLKIDKGDFIAFMEDQVLERVHC